MSTTPATISEDLTPAVPDDASILASLADENDPWFGVDDGDLTGDGSGRIPYLGLNRKVDGGFIDPDTGEVSQTLDFIWLAKVRSRAQWDVAFGGKTATAPDCRSFDGITSDPNSPNRKEIECATCPLSQWVDGEPPSCKESVEAMVFLPDPLGQGRLARIRFGGIAVAPARAYWDSFKSRLPRRPPMAYVSQAVLEPVDTDNGKFLRPRFARLMALTREDAQPLIAERDARLADWKADIAETVATAPAEDVGVGVVDGSQPGGTVTPGFEDEEPF